MADDAEPIERFEARWWTIRLAIIVLGVMGIVALCIPLASILADKDTRVSVNAALSFSAVATCSVAVTGFGWFASARAKRRLIRRVNRLEGENRDLRDTVERLEADQPPLDPGQITTESENK